MFGSVSAGRIRWNKENDTIISQNCDEIEDN